MISVIYFFWGKHTKTVCVCSCCCLITLVMSNSVRPYRLQPARLLSAWDSLGRSTGVGYHTHLQGLFLIQESNPSLLHCRQILYSWGTREALYIYMCIYMERERKRTMEQMQWTVQTWWVWINVIQKFLLPLLLWRTLIQNADRKPFWS